MEGDESSRHSNFSNRTRDSNQKSGMSNRDENSREEENSGDEIDLETGRQRTRKELRMLNFRNPGKFMDNFDPERSSREMRKMNRRIYKENLRKNQMYDEYGRLLDDLRDLCDCLLEECDGCHFPCTKCKSTKCGIDCRINRRYVYDQVEIEGSRTVINFSDTLEQMVYFK
ncbi:ARL14 effector protein-like [Lineus longissimus]|uniref:ARL14 effector protein-like n=1 Tax=Lineus longissimus TaxID=88925 RepID=UPI002B4EC0FB